MSGTRWSTVVAAITKDGGPIGPHPDPETQRLHTENPPKRRCPVPAPKNDHYEAPLHIEDPPAATVETPAENENPEDDELLPGDGLGTFYITTRPLTPEEPARSANPPSRRGWRRLFRRAA